MSDYKPIFIVSVINVKVLDEDDLRKEFEITKIKYPGFKYDSFDDFKEYEKCWKRDKYSFTIDDICYTKDINYAEEFINDKDFDINKDDYYDYASILVVRDGEGGGRYLTPYDVQLFKYNKEKRLFEREEDATSLFHKLLKLAIKNNRVGGR